MSNNLIMSLPRAAFLAACLFAAAPFAATAQDAVAVEPSRVTLQLGDGTEVGEYTIADVGVYLSETIGMEGEASTTDLSMSLSTITPLDPALLEWAAQTGAEGENLRTLSIVTSAGDGSTKGKMRYEVTGARVTSLSISHSTYAAASVSLQVLAETVTLDGIALN
jgi:hypothetical protein